MKTGIHPTYYPKAKVKCVCGAAFEIGSTVESYGVEICSKCHPFYTGKQKLVDTAGRVDRFKARQEVFEKRLAEQDARLAGKKKKETVEEKMTRKAQEKEDAKEAEKAAMEVAKKEAAKKKAEKLVVKGEKVEKKEEKEDVVEESTDSAQDDKSAEEDAEEGEE